MDSQKIYKQKPFPDCPANPCNEFTMTSCQECPQNNSCMFCVQAQLPACGELCSKRRLEQSVSDVIESIALVETAMAHILNAEGEKIQKAVALSHDIKELLEINHSVNKLIANTIQLEQNYYQKLDAVNELYRMGLEDSKNINSNPCQPYYPVCPCVRTPSCRPCGSECARPPDYSGDRHCP